MKIDVTCGYCGTVFRAHDWKGQRFCSKPCGNHSSKNKRHGLTDSIEHRAWTRIRRRCNSPSYHNYPRYGGRGIKVCERWDIFENFLADMGHRPTPKHTIDRINNDGNYEPGNCRWVTQAVQNQNRGAYNYSAEQDVKLREAIALGYNFPKMAQHVGKSVPSVMSRTYRLGLRSGQPAKPASPPARDTEGETR